MQKAIVKGSLTDKFFQRVQIKENDCWEWTGAKNPKGYGHLWNNGRNHGAHRISWIIHNGEIPENLVICHKCDNPSCVNPNHLYAGTQSQNIRESVRKGRFSTGKKHRFNLYPETRLEGEKHPGSKLTNESVLAIRKLFKEKKASKYQLAKIFGVDHGTICRVIKKQIWKHI